MRRWVTAIGVFICIEQTACAADDWDDWRIHAQPVDETQVAGDTQLRYLFEENGSYRLLGLGKKTDPRFELIGFDLEKRTILLLTSPYERPEPASRSETRLRCTSITGPRSRKNYYSICNSRFASKQGDIVQVDTEKLKNILQDTNFLGLVAELRLAQYRTDFANARTATSLAVFAERYTRYDPEGLARLARSRIRGQQIGEYENAFDAAMETPIHLSILPRKLYLQRFIDQYKNNDPRELVPKAEAELGRLAGLEQQQRRERWTKATEIGSAVCLEAPLLTDRAIVSGYIQIIGFTEQATPNKIKVLVNRILSRSLAAPWKDHALDNAIVDSISISTGEYSWFEREGWRLCQ